MREPGASVSLCGLLLGFVGLLNDLVPVKLCETQQTQGVEVGTKELQSLCHKLGHSELFDFLFGAYEAAEFVALLGEALQDLIIGGIIQGWRAA